MKLFNKEEDKSITNLIDTIKENKNAYSLEKDESLIKKFKNNYNNYTEKLFFRVATNFGGIVIDNWVRLYGCGKLNIIDKNMTINVGTNFDLLIGEDVCGGLFAVKDDSVYYFAPDTLKWESLDVYYSNFLYWLLNDAEGISLFYKSFRWKNWKDFCKDIKLDQGISFVPQLCFEGEIETRSKKIISMSEVIDFNFYLEKQIHSNSSN